MFEGTTLFIGPLKQKNHQQQLIIYRQFNSWLVYERFKRLDTNKGMRREQRLTADVSQRHVTRDLGSGSRFTQHKRNHQLPVLNSV